MRATLGEGTVNGYLATFKAFYGWLYGSGHLVKDVRLWIPKQKITRKVLKNVPTISQIKKLILSPDSTTPKGFRDRTMYLTQYAGGLRSKELLGMEIDSVDEIKKTIHVIRKGGDHQEIPVGSLAIHYLIDFIKEIRPKLKPKGAYLWPNDRGTKMEDHTYRKFLKRHLQSLNLAHFSSYDLRHVAVSHMMANGAPIYAIKHFLGHKDIESTEVYTKVDGGQVKKCIDRLI